MLSPDEMIALANSHIDAAIDTFPDLTGDGLHGKGSVPKPNAISPDQVAFAITWIRVLLRQARYLDFRLPKVNSYTAKHAVEEFTASIGQRDYCSNGALIAAAVGEGLTVTRKPGTPNATIKFPRFP